MTSFFSKNSLFYFSIIFTSLMLLDVISTKMALSQGYNEQNPIMRGIVNNTILFILLKLSITGVIIIMIRKCIKQDRKVAINGMRILTAFMLLVVLGNFSVIVGSAESGSVFISDDKSYNNSNTGTTCYLHTCSFYNLTVISLDTANYNYVSSYRLEFDTNYVTFTNQFESATWTIVSGGTGSGGYMWYDKNTSSIYFVPNSDVLFTAADMVIEYDHNIYANISFAVGTTSIGVETAPTSTNPVKFKMIWDGGARYLSSGNTKKHYAEVALRQTDTYNVEYSGNLFTIDINKGDSVNTKYFIDSYDGAQHYSQETTFNKVDINNALFIYGRGLSLNTTLSSGVYEVTYINASGCTDCEAEPPNTYPGAGANIYTDFPSYVVGDNINVEWFIADDPYDNALSSCEFIVNDAIIANSINQHDNYTIIQPTAGTYKLQIGCGVFSSTIVGETDVPVVAESQSYIIIQNGTAKAGSLNNFTYKWGFTPSTYRWLNIYKFDVVKNSWVKESSNSIQSASTANIIYNSSALIKSDGKYYAEICDNTRGCPTAKILFNSVYEANTPIYSYGYSNISILNPQATYAQNDWLSFNTRIDGTNFSSGKSFSVRLYNPATTTTKTLQYIHLESENNNVYLDSAMESGIQKLQLVGTNATGTYVLNQTDITISLLDANGFALYADKYNNVCPKESVIITAISPQNSTLTISVAPIKRYNFTGSKTVEIKGTSDYTASLDTNGNQNKLISIFVNSSCVLNPSEVPGTPTTPQTMNNLVSFLSLPAFWGILLFIVCVIGTAWRAPSAVGMVALIVSNLEAIIGLWAPYTIYVFIVTWIIAAIFFTIGRKTTTGGD